MKRTENLWLPPSGSVHNSAFIMVCVCVRACSCICVYVFDMTSYKWIENHHINFFSLPPRALFHSFLYAVQSYRYASEPCEWIFIFLCHARLMYTLCGVWWMNSLCCFFFFMYVDDGVDSKGQQERGLVLLRFFKTNDLISLRLPGSDVKKGKFGVWLFEINIEWISLLWNSSSETHTDKFKAVRRTKLNKIGLVWNGTGTGRSRKKPQICFWVRLGLT